MRVAKKKHRGPSIRKISAANTTSLACCSGAEIDGLLGPKYHAGSLIIIADGSKGEVSREKLGLADASSPKLVVEGTDLGRAEPHATLIANLRPNEDGSCPGLKRDGEGNVLDPYYPGFDMYPTHGVTSVFKRFFDNHCELQIFFASGIEGNGQSDTDVLDAVLDVLVEGQVEVERMKRFRVLPRRLDVIGGDIDRKKDFIVVGDAALSAHYRLGIGVNFSIYVAETTLNALLRNEVSAEEWGVAASGLYRDAQVTMHIYILLESECNLVLFENSVFQRDYEAKEYNEVDWSSVQVICEGVKRR